MNTFGTLFRLTSFGESHGPAIGGVIDGMPAGVVVDMDLLRREMARRRPGQSALTTARQEADEVELLSGVFEGRTTGAPIGFLVRNGNQHSADYDSLRDLFRPSHADYTYYNKYGLRDHRGGGRSSARETLTRCVAGAFAKMALGRLGVKVTAYTSQVGDIALPDDYTHYDLSVAETNAVRCPDAGTAARMAALISDVKAAGEDGDKAFAAFIDAVKKNKGVSTQVAGVSGAANTKYKVNNPAIQRAVDWAIAIANDDSFCYGLKDKKGGYASRCGCYFCGTNDKKVKMSGGDKRYYKTYVCMTFVHAAYAHGAGDPAMLKDCKSGTHCISAYRKSLKSGANQYGCWAPVGYTRNLKASDLQPGDVLIWPGVHMAMYLDNTHIVDAGGYGNGWGADTIAVRKQSWKGASYVIRYTGQGGPTGTTAAARKEYKKITTLKTLDPSTGKKVNVSPVAGHNFQSFAYAGKDIYLQSVPTGETGRNGYIYKCGANGKISSTSENLSIGHGNGLAYCTKDSTLYSVTVNGIGNNKKTSKIDPKALKITGTKSLKHGTSSIA